MRFAEKAAEKMGDGYVSVEHLMLGVFSEGSAAVRRILSDHGVTRDAFNRELAKVKSGPVNSDALRAPTTRSISTAPTWCSGPATTSSTPS